MLTVSAVSGFGARAASPLPGFMADLDAAGIAEENLHICLDAGTSDSYASGQTWSDLTDNGNDFFRGADASSDSTDPTHNGTPGDESSTEYWSVDGGDFFTKTSSNTTEINSWHKDAAKLAIAVWLYVPSSIPNDKAIVGTNNSAFRKGIIYYTSGSTKLQFECHSNGATAKNFGPVDTALKTSAWNFAAVVIDENGGSVSFHYLGNADGNGYNQISSADQGDAAYSSPSSDNCDDPVNIFCYGTSSGIMAADFRIGMVAAWDGGTLPTKAQFDTFYTSSKVRWGL